MRIIFLQYSCILCFNLKKINGKGLYTKFEKFFSQTTMNKTLLLCLILLTTNLNIFAQSNDLWAIKSEASAASLKKVQRTSLPTEFKVFKLDLEALRNKLQGAPLRGEFQGVSSVVVSFPDYEGGIEDYRVLEAPVMSPELQALYPQIRSYVAQSIKNPTNTIRFSVSPEKGLSGMIRSGVKGTTIIDPYTSDTNYYLVFNKSNSQRSGEAFTCLTEDEAVNFGRRVTEENQILNNADDNILRTFRAAFSVSGEYSTFHGGTLANVNAAINATLTRVNGIFENDFKINMVLVPNNDLVVFFNAGTDPYNAENTWASSLKTTLDANIGLANYDIGHLMNASGNNGNAGCIGCVCNANKGTGYTTSVSPTGDNFDIDFVAHEVGHQFGGNHTYSIDIEGTNVNVEPGSGTTIMGYAGITGPATDVQAHSDAYFHAVSIQQVTNNVKNKTCPTTTIINNAIPTANAGADVSLPIGTAFYLTGSGSDVDSDGLTYCWEQMNSATNANQTIPRAAATNGPMFRSFTPTASPRTYFPSLQSVIQKGIQRDRWEKVPEVTRNLAFRFTVRDNEIGGAANESDDMVVAFNSATGPFKVTSQNAVGQAWNLGSTQTITWSVNNTNTLTGAQNVNIKFSTDGGLTFPITLASNVPNNGSATVTAPSTPALKCRILIEPTNSSFYAVNSKPIALGYTVTTSCQTYDFTSGFAIPDNGSSYTVRTLNVPVGGEISDVNVNVNATHTWLSDLNMAIVSPAGTVVTLFNQGCSNNGVTDNLNATFDEDGTNPVCSATLAGSVLPDDVLSSLNGQNPLGNWTFGVVDLGAQDTGTLNSFSITVCTQTAVLGTDSFGLADFKIYPNPNKGNFNVQFNSDSGNEIKINIYDISGREIFAKSYQNSGLFSENLQLNSVGSGVYLVNVTDGDRKEVKKIVIN